MSTPIRRPIAIEMIKCESRNMLSYGTIPSSTKCIDAIVVSKNPYEYENRKKY